MHNEYRLIGVPGAGKTTTLKRRIEKLVREEGYDPSEVVTTSYSRAGAREIKGRVELPEENCATLHSFCFRALGLSEKKVADGSAATLKLWSEAYPLYALTRTADPASDLQPVGAAGKTLGDELMAKYQWARARLLPHEAWPPAVRAFAAAWEDWKDQHGFYDFTDMIEQCAGSMLPRCVWLFVDEAQDMSPLELRLVRDWGRYVERYVLAGDPNQAIYHFKGADGEGFYNPPLPPERTHVLKRSWRLPSTVAAAALPWQTFPTPVQPQREGGEVGYTGGTLRHLEGTLRLLERLLGEGKRVMLLASAGYLLGGLLAELRRRALPFHNPYQAANGAWNPMNPKRLGLLEAWLEGRADLAGVWKLTEHLPAAEAFHRNRKGLLEKAAKGRDPAQSGLATWDTLREYFPDRVAEALLSGDPWTLIRLLHLGGDKTRGLRYALEVIAAHGLDAARNPQVVVGTVHSVKGGEADAVFLWPDLSPAASRAWWLGGMDRAAIQRAVYVGMTRAKEALYLGAHSELGLDWFADAPNLAAAPEFDDDVLVI